ncbi:Hypothetical protein NTJ_00536 [Nesidiocoris tenuis]|uniref:Uncharacterized protein n=1 Tax=Nesidiocoris tenuis TaxID=355587 RepID=A0ABN7A6C1_9HEMI|nr:Hypothetical protein NTJ_00536 [Nesidiocoris tenuis]
MAAVSSPQPDFLLPAPCPLCSLVYLSLLLTPRRRLTAAPPSPRCASIPDHPDYQPHYADPPHHQHSRPFPPQFSLYPSGVHVDSPRCLFPGGPIGTLRSASRPIGRLLL